MFNPNPKVDNALFLKETDAYTQSEINDKTNIDTTCNYNINFSTLKFYYNITIYSSSRFKPRF